MNQTYCTFHCFSNPSLFGGSVPDPRVSPEPEKLGTVAPARPGAARRRPADFSMSYVRSVRARKRANKQPEMLPVCVGKPAPLHSSTPQATQRPTPHPQTPPSRPPAATAEQPLPHPRTNTRNTPPPYAWAAPTHSTAPNTQNQHVAPEASLATLQRGLPHLVAGLVHRLSPPSHRSQGRETKRTSEVGEESEHRSDRNA